MAILVTRPLPDGETTAAALRAKGFEVLLAPMLRFEPANFHDDPDMHFGAVIVTSANALRAIESKLTDSRLLKLPLFAVGDPARVSGGQVTFEPGARTMWHTHPLGQTLVITSGLGWVQTEGGDVQEVRPGDVVWFPSGEKHWHGATAATAMTHIAITESLMGRIP